MAGDNPWPSGRPDRAADYDRRFAALAESGAYLHGEADLVWSLLAGGADKADQDAPDRHVLDAGCGTGRVAIELARRGASVTGTDLDPAMLAIARAKAPTLEWVEADLADGGLDLGRRYDLVVAAGNVMIFVAPGTEHAVIATMARHLVPAGLLVTGFQLGPARLTLGDYDAGCAAAGLTLVERWATWERGEWKPGGEYAVSVHQATGPSTRSR